MLLIIFCMPDETIIDEKLAESFTKVLNRNGYGFQYSVLKKAKELAASRASSFYFEVSEFPVVLQGTHTRIDFILRNRFEYYGLIDSISLICECKRVNPAYSDWFFVKSPFIHARQSRDDNYLILESLTKKEGDGILHLASKTIQIANNYHIGLEAKTNKPGDSKGETGEAIERAATQVLRGMNGFIQTMNSNSDLWNFSQRVHFLPVIFTTANLFVSDADISLADLATGEINLSKEEIKSVPWLYYQYPMSLGLKHSVQNTAKEPRDLSSFLYRDYMRTIAIVSANGIEDFLTTANRYIFD